MCLTQIPPIYYISKSSSILLRGNPYSNSLLKFLASFQRASSELSASSTYIVLKEPMVLVLIWSKIHFRLVCMWYLFKIHFLKNIKCFLYINGGSKKFIYVKGIINICLIRVFNIAFHFFLSKTFLFDCYVVLIFSVILSRVGTRKNVFRKIVCYFHDVMYVHSQGKNQKFESLNFASVVIVFQMLTYILT